jgi:hypothetical protein
MGAAVTIIAAVREMVGDHVEHNAYFRDFPEGVPATMAFWVDCVVDALAAAPTGPAFGPRRRAEPARLRRYGRYQALLDGLIVRSILARRFLTVGDFVALLGPASPNRGQAFGRVGDLPRHRAPRGPARRIGRHHPGPADRAGARVACYGAAEAMEALPSHPREEAGSARAHLAPPLSS